MALKWIAVWGLLWLVGCKNETIPVNPKAVELYVDLLIAHETYQGDTIQFLQAKNGILTRSELSYPDLKKYLTEIENHPESWEAFQQSVVDKIKDVKTSYKGEKK